MAPKPTERSLILAARVRQALEHAEISQSELARRTGLPRRTIVRIVNGWNEPEQATLERIAAGTGKRLDFFAVKALAPSPRAVEAFNDFFAVLLADLRGAIADTDLAETAEDEEDEEVLAL